MESLQGGEFGHGFAAAGVTALVMPGVYGISNPVARATVGALVGGSLSELSGGKFANGAISGAVQAAMAGANNSKRGMTRDQLASYAEQAKYDAETALAVNPEASDFRSIRLTQQWADGEISDAQYREIMCNYCSDPTLQKVGIYGTLAIGTFGLAIEAAPFVLALRSAPLAFGRTANQAYHTFRHVEAAGLDRALVQQAVARDVATISGLIRAGQPFNQTITVMGQNITYTAYRLESGVINVGRITVP